MFPSSSSVSIIPGTLYVTTDTVPDTSPNGVVMDGAGNVSLAPGGSVIMDISSDVSRAIHMGQRGYPTSLSVYGDGNVSIPTMSDMISPSYAMTSDITGNIGRVDTLPISLGGTGMTTIPDANVMVVSNGVGYEPLGIGSNLVIDSDPSGSLYLDTGDMTQMNRMVLEASSDPIIVPTVGSMDVVREYTAASDGTLPVATMTIPTGSTITIGLMAVTRSDTEEGGSMQYMMVDSTGIHDFGTSMVYNYSRQSKVSSSITGDTITFSLAMVTDQEWRGRFQIVVLP